MMSKFKFCPICGEERENDEEFCHNCNFEYLIGNYVKLDNGSINQVDGRATPKVVDELAAGGADEIAIDVFDEFSDGADELAAEVLDDSIENLFDDLFEEEEIQSSEVSQEAFVEANDLIKKTDKKINESVDKCLNKIILNAENGSIDLDSEIISALSISVFTLPDLENNTDLQDHEFSSLIDAISFDDEYLDAQRVFIQWIQYNRGHLPGFIINQYKQPAQENVNKLNGIIESLETVENEEINKFKDLLNVYLSNQNSFLEQFY